MWRWRGLWRVKWRRVLLVGALVGVVAWAWSLAPDGPTTNPRASCANCRHQLGSVLVGYADEHEWFPRGGATPLESLAKAIDERGLAECASSHALAAEAGELWETRGVLSEELCLFAYNEGLHRNDRSTLVLLYTKEPGTWECRFNEMEEVGRAVCGTDGSWRWLPEAEFQRVQGYTEGLLAARRSRR